MHHHHHTGCNIPSGSLDLASIHVQYTSTQLYKYARWDKPIQLTDFVKEVRVDPWNTRNMSALRCTGWRPVILILEAFITPSVLNDSVEIPTRCRFVIEFIIPKFLKAQHVSSGTPLIIRSSKLYLQPLVYIPMWWPAVAKAEWALSAHLTLATAGHHSFISI